jgi:glycosyltransferase involved in cell wall biosynthesis
MIMKHAHATIFLSSYDMSQAKSRYQINKIYSHIPGSLINHNVRKCEANERLYLLFSCNINFLPNRSALEWIATQLSPQLLKMDCKINIIVTGVSDADVPSAWRQPNVQYIGFLNEANFRDLFGSVSGFLCPIEFGSGIKMKIIEALQAGLPVFATAKSWRGLEKVGENYILPSSPVEAAQFIQAFSSSTELGILRDIMVSRYNALISNQLSCSNIFNEIMENF